MAFSKPRWTRVFGCSSPQITRSDLHLTSASDPVLDSSRTLIRYYACGGVSAAWCDQEWTTKFNNLLGQSGEARAKGFQELWKTAYDQNVASYRRKCELTGISPDVLATFTTLCQRAGHFLLVLVTPECECSIDVQFPSGITRIGAIEPHAREP